MIAMISLILSWWKGPALRRFHHIFNLPWPQVMHETVQEDFISEFKEVFVIGDVHGCFDELVELLNKAEVVDDSSLKIFVGDLINKGPKNREVLQLLMNSKSMLAVRGNRDEVVLREYFESQSPNFQLTKPDNKWIMKLSEEEANYLAELPYTISIPLLKAVIVHAGLVPGVPLNSNDPLHLVTMRNLMVGDYFGGGGIQAIKHDKEGVAWASLWPGPEHVYFGHDAKRSLQQEAFATGLDTGCVYGNSLTGMFISGSKNGKLIQVEAKKTYRIPKKLQRKS